MAGQAHHFRAFASEHVPYGIQPLHRRGAIVCTACSIGALADRECIAGEYSIADMACWPWIVLHDRQGQALEDFPNVQRWFDAVTRAPGRAPCL